MPLALSRRRSTRVTATVLCLVTAIMTGTYAVRAVTAWRAPVTVSPIELPAPDVELSAALHGRTGAFLTVGDAASLVEIRAADLPGLLYQVSTPAGSGLTPAVTGRAGRVGVRFRPAAGTGPNTVTILVNRRVRWDIRLPAGAGEQHLDLRQGRVTRLDLGSAALIRLRLPRPAGLVPITFRDAVGAVNLTSPAPVRLRLDRGAGTVSTPWRKPGSGGPACYSIVARGRVETLTVSAEG